ncbi:dihydroneopterin aldolase [Marinimicrococcus flavescens]|uniref:dihydroneopterin aldolase n=1 Tax=Marinimicrococcus flavescens TaxID=3031815 RepID=A0AAP3V0F5_9PROT|nr:dihydroneopterin aldolase [Marinimicrococcus flavescens]
MRDEGRSYQCLALRHLALEVRIGVNPAEKTAPQRVLVDVELMRGGGPFPAESLADCLDYDRVYRHLTESWPQRPHTELIEVLAEDLLAFCFEDPRVDACRVIITKPDIYGGRACPGIEVYRRRHG